MRTPPSHHRRKAKSKGAAFVEYVVLMGLIGVVVIFSVLQLGGSVQGVFNDSSTTVETEIEDATGIALGGPSTPTPQPGGGGGGGNPSLPNTPGGAPPVGPLVAVDTKGDFGIGSQLIINCVQTAAQPLVNGELVGASVWCSGEPLENRPSNLEWRTNTSTGAAIWHGQLCMYDTSAGAFVTSVHYIWDLDNNVYVPGIPEYDGTWLACQSSNQPSAGLQGDGGVASWDYEELVSGVSMWYPGPSGNRGLLPAEVPFQTPPTWSEDYASLIANGYPGECTYSTDMQRWLTQNIEMSGGTIQADIACQ
jgi:Flp pilus assembly pilin Flp